MRVALLAPDVSLSSKTEDAWHVKDVSSWNLVAQRLLAFFASAMDQRS